MNLTIIGTGFVGVVSAAVFASQGNTVVGLDIDPKRIDSLRKGKVPFYEPGLEELLVKTQKRGNLSFTTSYEEAIPQADVVIIAVGTPSAPDGQADLTYVFAAAESIAPFLQEGTIVAIKSTVPPGTCQKVSQKVQEKNPKAKKIFMASLPEFLKEGSAVNDTLHPDRIVIGATDTKAIETLSKLHEPFQAELVIMKPDSAQMCKYAANAYLATRITFINQIANLCEINGADILEVIRGIGFDKRIGSHYWYPGLGYGGSCFPKDVKELAAYARAVGHEDNLMVTISALNENRIISLLQTFEKEVGGFADKKIAVLGLSFKPNTDDMREAPSTKVIPLLLHAKAKVHAYDPMANEAARLWATHAGILENDSFRIENTVENALRDADIVFVLVEWKEFVELPVKEIAHLVSPKAWIIDTRNQYSKGAFAAFGLQYRGIGK